MSDDLPVSDLLRHYALHDVTLSPLAQGGDNLSLLVSAREGRYVLRCYRLTSQEEVGFELELIDYLVERGFSTPSVVRTSAGSRAANSGPYTGALFRFVDGRPLGEGSDHDAARVAVTCARLHLLTENHNFAGHRSRTDEGMLRLYLQRFGSDAEFAGTRGAAEFASAIRELLDQTARWKHCSLPVGTLHHDLHGDNILVDPVNGEIRALLDFDCAFIGPFVLDVATLLHYWARGTDRWYEPDAARKVLNAYESVRPLSDMELNELPLALRVFTAADACDFILRAYASRPEAFQFDECDSLRSLKGSTEQSDWLL